MGLEIKYGTGQTPINEDEVGSLIPFWISTNEELNLLEQQNINKAIKFFARKNLKSRKILSVYFLKNLHKKCLARCGNGLASLEKQTKI